ncbi:MAG: HAD superfamily hydrolase (TIGR01490 family) [Nonlabens sp.]|jgi:HAD superfamily hydrolase (TIGR01490 family)
MASSTPAARGAAFFDLDRTLISGSSAVDFGIAAWRNKLIPGSALIRDAGGAIAFRLAGASDEKSVSTRDRLLGAVKGIRQDDLLALNEEIIPRVLSKVRPESKGLIDMHHEAGRDCFIVSASPVELVEPLARALGMQGGIGTRPATIDGVYTGELDGPFCYGDGKRIIIEKIAASRGYDLQLSYGYSDSASDLPMLELVGHPVAVNPDSPLEAVAHQRGWPVVVFARKRKQVVRSTTASVSAVALGVGTYALGRRHGRVVEAARVSAHKAPRGRAGRRS